MIRLATCLRHSSDFHWSRWIMADTLFLRSFFWITNLTACLWMLSTLVMSFWAAIFQMWPDEAGVSLLSYLLGTISLVAAQKPKHFVGFGGHFVNLFLPCHISWECEAQVRVSGLEFHCEPANLFPQRFGQTTNCGNQNWFRYQLSQVWNLSVETKKAYQTYVKIPEYLFFQGPFQGPHLPMIKIHRNSWYLVLQAYNMSRAIRWIWIGSLRSNCTGFFRHSERTWSRSILLHVPVHVQVRCHVCFLP